MDEYSMTNMGSEGIAPTAPDGGAGIDVADGVAILRDLWDAVSSGGGGGGGSAPTTGGPMTPAQQIALYERIGWPPPGEARLRPILEAAAAGRLPTRTIGRAPTPIAGARPPSVPDAPAGATGEIDGTVMLVVGGLVVGGLVIGGAVVLLWALA